METGIIMRLSEISGVPADAIKETSLLADELMIDSLTLLQLVLELEEKTGKRFDDDELAKVKTAGDIMKLLR